MDDERFEQNFMWFEWGFVSPKDFPGDDAPGARPEDEINGLRRPTHEYGWVDVWNSEPS